jgi:branched-chain amino acid transport system permease protein
MLGALGVNQAWLFTGVFALGAALAGLGGALQLPGEPASLGLDLRVIGEAFVVVVVGGMGSIPGAYVAALLIAQIKALCIGLGNQTVLGVTLSFSKLTLVVEFLFMAAVLVSRPWGLFGRPLAAQRAAGLIEEPLRPASRGLKMAGLALLAALALLPLLPGWLPLAWLSYAPVLAQDMLIAALFALSLHFIMGPGGMASFGHAAYFGLGAYGAALLLKAAALPMEAALLLGPLAGMLAALVFGWFCVRLSGVYLAMLTLAFAQIIWSVAYQWDGFTGGSNGLFGVWPAPYLSGAAYYYVVLAFAAVSLLALRRILFSPFGYALRAARDSALRAEAIGIDTRRVQWLAFAAAGLFAGLAGALFVFSKGGVSPDAMSVGKSVDGLVMVLLGGVQSLTGPLAGAAAFTLLQDAAMRATEYWRALLGGVMLLLALVFPAGVCGPPPRRFAPPPQGGGGRPGGPGLDAPLVT